MYLSLASLNASMSFFCSFFVCLDATQMLHHIRETGSNTVFKEKPLQVKIYFSATRKLFKCEMIYICIIKCKPSFSSAFLMFSYDFSSSIHVSFAKFHLLYIRVTGATLDIECEAEFSSESCELQSPHFPFSLGHSGFAIKALLLNESRLSLLITLGIPRTAYSSSSFEMVDSTEVDFTILTTLNLVPSSQTFLGIFDITTGTLLFKSVVLVVFLSILNPYIPNNDYQFTDLEIEAGTPETCLFSVHSKSYIFPSYEEILNGTEFKILS
ncbi:hypothetical protein BpHYR1_009559 [Brachionus plicatilis]|uniref:Uncharacterized protein n=1 Tax=Brachionus plicatilis TaxID=10195 RepID=A0A3M7RDX1_BRAPC|nr:hypothetical protein BpHYR1_009559 [Brachionus plicatilis]